MASTQMLTGDPNTIELWQKETWLQTMQKTYLGDLFDGGAIYYNDKFLGRDAKGDRLNIDYIGRMTGVPKGEGQTLVGEEQALDIKNFQMTVNESRDAVKFPNSGIEPQRTNIKFEQTVKRLIPQRSAELVQASFFAQAAGFNPTSFTSPTDGVTYASTADKLHVQGHNTPVAPSSARVLRAGGGANDQAITSADTFTYSLIDYALELNDVSLQPIKPLADGYFRLYLDPYSFTNLKQDVTSPIQWGNIALSQIQGGMNNGMLGERYMDAATGLVECGIYQNVKIFSCKDVVYGQRSDTSAVITTVRRNVLIGQDAVAFASPLGGRVTDNVVPLKIIDQLEDYGKYKGVGFELLYGMKKVITTGGAATPQDVGAFVISCYAASHT